MSGTETIAKPEPQPDSDASDRTPADDGKITLRIRDAAGAELSFKVRKTTPFSKVFDVFCQKKCHNRASMRFLFDGIRVPDTQTPEGLELEDGDSIDAVIEQVGGARVL